MKLLLAALFAVVIAGVLWFRRAGGARGVVISSPVLGVLRLDAGAANATAAADRRALTPIFGEPRESDSAPPRCDVLLVYGDLDASGRFAKTGARLRDLIRDAGAKVVVVASDNPAERYIAGSAHAEYGLANLVMTLDRKGDATPRFLSELFAAMGRGVPMPQAWVQLAPQNPKDPRNAAAPEMMFAAELGQVAFGFAPAAA